MMHPSSSIKKKKQSTTNPNKQVIILTDYLKGGDSKYISKGRENVAKPKHFVEVMTHYFTVHSCLPPLCPGVTKTLSSDL